VFALPTLKEFLDNPMGKGSTAIPNRQLIKDDLNKRYKELTKKKKISHKVYKRGDDYYFHMKIPSESERDNTYDVVLLFTIEDDKDLKYDNFLNRYYVKFFSNCPSFTYTFAQVFNQYGFLIKELGGKYNNIVLNNEPIIRNPGQIVSFEKSIYFAALYVNDSFILKNKLHLNQNSESYDKTKFVNSIRNTDTIELEIKKANNELKKRKLENEEAEKKKRKAIERKVLPIKEKIIGQRGVNVIKPKSKIVAANLKNKKK
jgi:hypothetical protein